MVDWEKNSALPLIGAVGAAVGQQLIGRLVAVVLHQLHHAVLHDIQCRLVIAHMVDRTLESAFFHAFEEVGQFFFGGQGLEPGGARVFLRG